MVNCDLVIINQKWLIMTWSQLTKKPKYHIRKKVMKEEFRKEQILIEKNEFQKETDLIKIIIKTQEELKNANKNYEFADNDLIDYYIYQIKANQAKLNYLIKIAKIKGINVDFIKDMEYRFWEEDAV